MKQPKAFLFDFFGTVADWRYPVTKGLSEAAQAAIAKGSGSPEAIQAAKQMTWTRWEALAVEWYAMYIRFAAGFLPGVSSWVDTGEVHMRSLHLLLAHRKLTGLWSESELQELRLLWHKLDEWPDSRRGVELLSKIGVTGTLSNGSKALLADNMKANGVPFDKILCADDFRAYKPAPEVYTKAVRKVVEGTPAQDKVKPEDVAMVAAHLGDLQAAKRQGLMTIYVSRPLEEEFTKDKIDEIRAQGYWVDMWVDEGEGGIEEVARRLEAL